MGEPPKISEAEWDVMNVVWDRGPVTAQDVHAALGDAKAWSPRTVKTLLGRLVKKAALDFDVDGRRYRYRARVSREDCIHAESETFVARVFGGKASPMLAHFVREGHLSREEIDKLLQLLDEEKEAKR